MLPPQERILERIREQIVDAHVSQVVERAGVPKTPSRDRILQCTVEQILDVLVPEMVKQLVEETVGGGAEDRSPGQNAATD